MPPARRCSSAVKQHRVLDSGRAGRADQGQPEADAGAVVSGNFWLEFPGFHDPKNPFHDKRVREAISLAIDRDAVNEAESAGYGMVDGNWINDDVQYALTWPKRSSARSIVAEMCDKMAVMYAVKIVEQGAVRDLFRSPKHPYTRFDGKTRQQGAALRDPGTSPRPRPAAIGLRILPALPPCHAAMRQPGAPGSPRRPELDGAMLSGRPMRRRARGLPAALQICVAATLTGAGAGASSARPISSIERPFVSMPRNAKTRPACPYQKARKSNAGKSASSVTFGLT